MSVNITDSDKLKMLRITQTLLKSKCLVEDPNYVLTLFNKIVNNCKSLLCCMDTSHSRRKVVNITVWNDDETFLKELSDIGLEMNCPVVLNLEEKFIKIYYIQRSTFIIGALNNRFPKWMKPYMLSTDERL